MLRSCGFLSNCCTLQTTVLLSQFLVKTKPKCDFTFLLCVDCGSDKLLFEIFHSSFLTQSYVNNSGVLCAEFILNKQVIDRDVLHSVMWKITSKNPNELPAETFLICVER